MDIPNLNKILDRVAGLMGDLQIAATTVFREARGEPYEGKVAVARVILNRVTDKQGRWPKTAEAVCLQKYQFSCWDLKDDNSLVFPDPVHEPGEYLQFRDCIRAVLEALTRDPVDGANHYVNLDVAQPSWRLTMVQTVKWGKHTFFRA